MWNYKFPNVYTVMWPSPDRATRRFRPASLDALNFLLSDVRGALGPYLNVFLVTQQHWSQSTVGLVTALSGWLGQIGRASCRERV